MNSHINKFMEIMDEINFLYTHAITHALTELITRYSNIYSYMFRLMPCNDALVYLLILHLLYYIILIHI